MKTAADDYAVADAGQRGTRDVAVSTAGVTFATTAGAAEVAWVTATFTAEEAFVGAEGAAHATRVAELANLDAAYLGQEAASYTAAYDGLDTASGTPWSTRDADHAAAGGAWLTTVALEEAILAIARANADRDLDLARATAEKNLAIALTQASSDEWLALVTADLAQVTAESSANQALAATAGWTGLLRAAVGPNESPTEPPPKTLTAPDLGGGTEETLEWLVRLEDFTPPEKPVGDEEYARNFQATPTADDLPFGPQPRKNPFDALTLEKGTRRDATANADPAESTNKLIICDCSDPEQDAYVVNILVDIFVNAPDPDALRHDQIARELVRSGLAKDDEHAQELIIASRHAYQEILVRESHEKQASDAETRLGRLLSEIDERFAVLMSGAPIHPAVIEQLVANGHITFLDALQTIGVFVLPDGRQLILMEEFTWDGEQSWRAKRIFAASTVVTWDLVGNHSQLETRLNNAEQFVANIHAIPFAVAVDKLESGEGNIVIVGLLTLGDFFLVTGMGARAFGSTGRIARSIIWGDVAVNGALGSVRLAQANTLAADGQEFAARLASAEALFRLLGVSFSVRDLASAALDAVRYRRTLASEGVARTVFRGERSSRTPDIVFNEGLPPKGGNTDLLRHLTENLADSNFVATSIRPRIAKGFAGKNGWLYVIRTKNGIDVNVTLGSKSPFPEQFEIAIPGGVTNLEVMGAFRMRKGEIISEFIRNSYYRR